MLVISVGVPLIRPVLLSKVSPAGSAGEIDHCSTGPPVETGDWSMRLKLLSNSTSLGTYAMMGRLSRTVMLM